MLKKLRFSLFSSDATLIKEAHISVAQDRPSYLIQVLVPDSSISSATFISTVRKRKIDEFELFGHL